MKASQKNKFLNSLAELQRQIDVIYSEINSVQCEPDSADQANAESSNLLSFRDVPQASPAKLEFEYGGLISLIRKSYVNADGKPIHIDCFDWLRELQNQNVQIKEAKKKVKPWMAENKIVSKKELEEKGGQLF